MGRPGTFQRGNKAGVGVNKRRPDFLTQALISQLNEIDKSTGKAKIHMLAERLLCHALGGSYRIGDRMVEVDSGLHAIKEVFDRVQGKAPQSFTFEDPEGGSVLRLEVVECVVVDPSPDQARK